MLNGAARWWLLGHRPNGPERWAGTMKTHRCAHSCEYVSPLTDGRTDAFSHWGKEGGKDECPQREKDGQGCPLCAEECAVHSIVIRRLLFKPDEARRAREDNSKSDSKAAAREEKGRGGQAGKMLLKLTTWGMHEVRARPSIKMRQTIKWCLAFFLIIVCYFGFDFHNPFWFFIKQSALDENFSFVKHVFYWSHVKGYHDNIRNKKYFAFSYGDEQEKALMINFNQGAKLHSSHLWSCHEHQYLNKFSYY